jgi:CubicO group peptidase (beta-lactamase class C family)
MRILLLSLLLGGCAAIPEPASSTLTEASVAFDRTGERGSLAAGLADPATGRPLSIDDPVRIASVSKLVVAIGVLKLVETGQLDLDRDVSEYLGWPLRNPAFPGRSVTVRQLLSHTSGARDGDDIYVVPLGDKLRDTMARADAWDTAHPPGAYFTYANLNFPLVGSVIERITNERFDLWMRRELLNPMRIDACFNWPSCSDAAVKRAVVLMQDGKPVRDDLRGTRPECPVVPTADGGCDLRLWTPGENGALFSPQGGLRISARGLARVGRMLLNSGTLDGVRILSPKSVDTMLRPLWVFDGKNGETDEGFYCSYGLATQQIATGLAGCRDDPLGDGRQWAGHAGEAYGLRSGLWIDRSSGTGVAYFTTGLAEDPPRGRTAFRAAEEAAFARSAALLRR